MLLPPLTVTRDLIHYRKTPARQTALHTVASTFLTLLSSPSSAQPVAPSLRAAFLPALLGVDARPRDAALLARADEQLRLLFAERPPSVVLLQSVPSAEQVEAAWRASEGGEGGGGMRERVFVAFALNQELERAKEEDEREEVANLSMMVIATLAYELAHWICVKMRGYHSALDPSSSLASDTASLRSSLTGVSIATTTASSAFSTGSGGPLAPPRQPGDAGLKAVLALLGVDYELLTFSIGTRQLVKRRYPTRRSPSLSPPVVYALIGDTPAIVDATSWPPTHAGMVPPQYGEDSMYAVTAVLTPAGSGRMHGECVVSEGGGAASSVGSGGGANGSSVQVNLQQREGDEEKVLDRMYSGL